MKESRDIKWLVHWAFGAQKVEAAVRASVPAAPTISSTAMMELMALGCRVDNSSKAVGLGTVVIYDLVCRLPKEAAGLVALRARAGTRPEYCPEGAGEMVPVLDKRGRPHRIWRDPVRREGDLGPMMEWHGTTREAVNYHREIWAVWREALPRPGGAFCFGARRVSQLTIRWRDIGELSRFDNMLKVLSTDQFNKVMVRSVNRAGDMAYKGRGTSVVRTLAKQTGLTQKLMRKAIKVRRANYRRLEYELRVEGGDISLRYFSPRETRRGVTAKIKGSRQLFEGAFTRAGRFPNRVNVPAFHGHVFQRLSYDFIEAAGRFARQQLFWQDHA